MTDVSQAQDRATSRRMGSLAGLWPFLRPYRGLLIGALLSLVLTASVSLALPMAVRRVVDGFGSGELQLLNEYFVAALALAVLRSSIRGCCLAIPFRPVSQESCCCQGLT